MRFRSALFLLAALATLPAVAPQPPRQVHEGAVSLTIYNQNLALVRTGMSRVLEPGSHTVHVEGLPAQLDRDSVMVADPRVVLRGVRDYRTYQSATEGSGAGITIDLDVAERLERLDLVFLTAGLSWSASYNLVVAPDDRSARVEGFATITNASGARYEGAAVQLLAGTISQQGPITAGGRFESLDEMRFAAEAVAGSPSLSQVAFGGYHLYSVSDPLALATGEARRIRMWGADCVETTREYLLVNRFNYYQQYPEPVIQPATVRYRVARPAGTEFGDVPLPAGGVRILQPDDSGRPQLLGIAGIPNTPAERELILGIGAAFDIAATRTQTDYRRIDGRHESEWRIELSNASDEDVVVQVVEGLSGDWTLMRSTHEGEKLSAAALRFPVAVAAGGSATLEYRVSVR